MDNKPRRRSSRQVPRPQKNAGAQSTSQSGAKNRQPRRGVNQAASRRRSYTMFGGVAAAAIILAIILLVLT